MMSVNTLGEVPEANGYIVELGMRRSDNPASSLSPDDIRVKMGSDEWFVRTGDLSEEQELMLQIDKEVDHGRLPAYLILGDHPEDATDAVVVYLDQIETADEALETLERAVDIMQEMYEEESTLNMSTFADRMSTESAAFVLGISADAIQHITFAGIM